MSEIKIEKIIDIYSGLVIKFLGIFSMSFMIVVLITFILSMFVDFSRL
jgi:hypothetical protein